jgi:serine/threonine-protein kinase
MSLIGKKVGNYEIKQKLGEGGMGAVYLGEHPLIGKKVAIKVLLEEFATNEQVVTRFFNEAKAVNDIGHPNIVDIIDFGKMPSDSGAEMVYFVMELLDGESLSHRIQRQPLSIEETLHVIEQCCTALSASHAKGIVHRDLKPDNLYLCPRGTDKNFVKILDFGIAKLTGAGQAGSKTRTGSVIGTPYYMSPEQCAGRGHIDHRSDIYSLGCVMYELCTGRLPFPGEGFGDILVAQLTKQPDAPTAVRPDFPPAIEKIILKAMEKERDNRFQSMDEFAAAVRDPSAHAAGRTGGDGFVFKPMYSEDQSAKVKLPTFSGESKPGYNSGSGQVPALKGPITTLSGAASEMAGGQRRAGSTIAVVAAVLVVGGAAGFFALRPKSAPPVAPTPAAMVAPAPAAPRLIEVKVLSEPPGAQVIRADQAEGPRLTPAIFKLHEGDPSFDVLIKLDGYKPQTRTIVAKETKSIEVQLAKDVTAAAAPVEPVKKKKRATSTTSTPGHEDGTMAPIFN